MVDAPSCRNSARKYKGNPPCQMGRHLDPFISAFSCDREKFFHTYRLCKLWNCHSNAFHRQAVRNYHQVPIILALRMSATQLALEVLPVSVHNSKLVQAKRPFIRAFRSESTGFWPTFQHKYRALKEQEKFRLQEAKRRLLQDSTVLRSPKISQNACP